MLPAVCLSMPAVGAGAPSAACSRQRQSKSRVLERPSITAIRTFIARFGGVGAPSPACQSMVHPISATFSRHQAALSPHQWAPSHAIRRLFSPHQWAPSHAIRRLFSPHQWIPVKLHQQTCISSFVINLNLMFTSANQSRGCHRPTQLRVCQSLCPHFDWGVCR